MNFELSSNLAEFNATFAKYVQASGKTAVDVLPRTANNLGLFLYKRLRALMPPAGSIRESRLQALKQGEGVIVRESILAKVFQKHGAHTDIKTRTTQFFKNVKAKRYGVKGITRDEGGIGLQALAVKRELSARESGRGYLSIGTLLRGIATIKPGGTRTFTGRYGQRLADAIMVTSGKDGAINIKLGNNEVTLGTGLNKPKALAAVSAGINDARKDMIVYIKRKQAEARAALLKRGGNELVKAGTT